MTPIPSAETDAWNLARGSSDARPTRIRYRPGLREFCGDSRFTRRLTIKWSYDVQEESGLPTEDQAEELKHFEDSLQTALDPERIAILAFVFTSAGVREWHYYCEDMALVGEQINAALADSPNLPINLESVSEPDWAKMRQVLSQCRE